jgi:predicted amidohydrolase
MKTALIQMDIVLGDVSANRKKAQSMIEEGLRAGAQLFVLPELWTTGYKLDQIHQLAEPDNGPTLQMLKNIAKQNQVEIMGGSLAELRDGKVYNTAYAFNQAGEMIGKYSKIHLIGLMAEDKYIAPGSSKCAFDMSFGKVGMNICYDLRFLELPRALALGGCQVMFVPAEWPTIRGKHWLTLNMARAIENQMFVLAVNRVGKDDNNAFFGNSMLIDPWGEVLAHGSSDQEEVVIADVDFSSVADIRKRIPVFADRRPQYY